MPSHSHSTFLVTSVITDVAARVERVHETEGVVCTTSVLGNVSGGGEENESLEESSEESSEDSSDDSDWSTALFRFRLSSDNPLRRLISSIYLLFVSTRDLDMASQP